MLRKLWRSFEIFAAVCVLILLVGSLVLAVATGSFTDDQKAGASTGNAGTSSGPSGYNTLFYDPEPPELTPGAGMGTVRAAALLGPARQPVARAGGYPSNRQRRCPTPRVLASVSEPEIGDSPDGPNIVPAPRTKSGDTEPSITAWAPSRSPLLLVRRRGHAAHPRPPRPAPALLLGPLPQGRAPGTAPARPRARPRLRCRASRAPAGGLPDELIAQTVLHTRGAAATFARLAPVARRDFAWRCEHAAVEIKRTIDDYFPGV